MMTAMQTVDLRQIDWVGVLDLQTHPGGGVQPWRLPLALLDFLDERTRFQAGNPSGVRLRLAGAMRRVALEVEPADEERWFDLLVDDRLFGRVALPAGATQVAFDDLPADDKVLELWLHHLYCPVIVRALSIDAGASWRRAPAPGKPRILFHGSSISHGRGAAGPTEAWTVGAARLAGLEPINLGLGGACRLEPAVARVIRDQPADFLSFCFGVNVVMGRSHNARAFRAGVVGFLQIVREGHPLTPLAVQGPIVLRDEPVSDDPEQLTLARSREILAEVVDCFRRHGDRKIIYGGDLEMLGESEVELLYDGVHPNTEGHRLMSRRYVEQVWPRLAALGGRMDGWVRVCE